MSDHNISFSFDLKDIDYGMLKHYGRHELQTLYWREIPFFCSLERRVNEGDADVFLMIHVYPTAMDGTWEIQFDVEGLAKWSAANHETVLVKFSKSNLSATFSNRQFEFPIKLTLLDNARLIVQGAIKIGETPRGFHNVNRENVNYFQAKPHDDLIVKIGLKLIYTERNLLATHSSFFHLAVYDKEPDSHFNMYIVDITDANVAVDDFICTLVILEGRHYIPYVESFKIPKIFKIAEQFGIDKVKQKLGGYLMLEVPFNTGLSFSEIVLLSYKFRNSTACNKAIARMKRIGELPQLFESKEYKEIEGKLKENLEKLKIAERIVTNVAERPRPSFRQAGQDVWTGFTSEFEKLHHQLSSPFLYIRPSEEVRLIEKSIRILNSMREKGYEACWRVLTDALMYKPRTIVYTLKDLCNKKENLDSAMKIEIFKTFLARISKEHQFLLVDKKGVKYELFQ